MERMETEGGAPGGGAGGGFGGFPVRRTRLSALWL
jgi:hypothetical protein